MTQTIFSNITHLNCLALPWLSYFEITGSSFRIMESLPYRQVLLLTILIKHIMTKYQLFQYFILHFFSCGFFKLISTKSSLAV